VPLSATVALGGLDAPAGAGLLLVLPMAASVSVWLAVWGGVGVSINRESSSSHASSAMGRRFVQLSRGNANTRAPIDRSDPCPIRLIKASDRKNHRAPIRFDQPIRTEIKIVCGLFFASTTLNGSTDARNRTSRWIYVHGAATKKANGTNRPNWGRRNQANDRTLSI